MKFKEMLLLTTKNIKNRGIRSLLTVLGVVIGVAAVVSLTTLGNGLKNAINYQINRIGTHTITMTPGNFQTGGQMPLQAERKGQITMKDYKIIKSHPGVEFAEPTIMQMEDIYYKNEKYTSYLVGASENMEKLTNLNIIEGRFLNKNDKKGVVLGYSIAKDIFKDEIKIGNRIKIKNETFTVVGIFEKLGGFGNNDDYNVYILRDSLLDLYPNVSKDFVSVIMFKVRDSYDVEKVKEELTEKLRRKRHEVKGEETFSLITSENMMNIVNNILGIVTAFLSGLVAISLIVGGVGIMNTMFMSVMERTREIGIMKAIGATEKDILFLFLVESSILGFIGGVVGLFFGYVTSYSTEILFAKDFIKIEFSPNIVFFVLIFSIIVGGLAGLLPAKRASRLNVIEALRYE